MNKVNKAELIEKVAEKSGLTKADAKKAVESTISVIKETLIDDGKVSIVGFGTFKVTHRKARVGRNPQNIEEEINIPASKGVKFTFGNSFKEEINK